MKHILIIIAVLLFGCKKEDEVITMRIETSKPSELEIRKTRKDDKSKSSIEKRVIKIYFENVQDVDRYYDYIIDCDSGTTIKAFKNGKLIYNQHANHHEVR